MFIVAPNPNSFGGTWQDFSSFASYEKNLPETIKHVAKKSNCTEVCVFRMTELHYVNVKIDTQKYVVTDKGEVIPA